MPMRTLVAALFSVSVLFLTACGTSKSDRALSGAGIGAGAGAAVGAATGGAGGAVGGAVIGGAAGAAAGVLTDEDDVNLGDPPWK